MTLDEWVSAVFGCELTRFLDEDDLPPECLLEAPQCLEYLTRVFEDPKSAFEGLDEAKVAQGLFLVLRDEGWTDVTLDLDLPESARIRCIDAMVTVFTDYLCGDVTKELASVRYMWWDVFRTWGSPGDPEMANTDAAILRAMESILQIDCEGCQESAIHGLNHWQSGYPQRVVSTINAFLKRNPSCSEALRKTAEAAKQGHLQ